MRVKLKINKNLMKGSRIKTKIKRIKTKVEISRTKRISLYFLGRREKRRRKKY
jgi:hypothetical protein